MRVLICLESYLLLPCNPPPFDPLPQVHMYPPPPPPPPHVHPHVPQPNEKKILPQLLKFFCSQAIFRDPHTHLPNAHPQCTPHAKSKSKII